MKARRIGTVIAVIILLSLLMYMAFTYNRLPERIAIHFGPQNKPNQWAEKSSFFLWFPILVLGLNILDLVILPKLTSKIPHSAMNIPWKKYWFAEPERKFEAIQRINAILSFSALFVNIIFLFAYHIIYLENIPNPPYHIPYSTGLYFIFGITLVFLVFVFLYLIVSFKPLKVR